MLKRELVNEICREEPVCSKCRDGLVFRNVGARSPVLRGELVNENCREEPVCLIVNVGARPSASKGELIRVSNWARLHKQQELVFLC